MDGLHPSAFASPGPLRRAVPTPETTTGKVGWIESSPTRLSAVISLVPNVAFSDPLSVYSVYSVYSVGNAIDGLPTSAFA